MQQGEINSPQPHFSAVTFPSALPGQIHNYRQESGCFSGMLSQALSRYSMKGFISGVVDEDWRPSSGMKGERG